MLSPCFPSERNSQHARDIAPWGIPLRTTQHIPDSRFRGLDVPSGCLNERASARTDTRCKCVHNLPCLNKLKKREQQRKRRINGNIPVHCQFFFVTGLYGTSLGKILYDFHRPVELSVDEFMRVHCIGIYKDKPLVRCSGESWACQKGTSQAVGVGLGSRVAVAACHSSPCVSDRQSPKAATCTTPYTKLCMYS